MVKDIKKVEKEIVKYIEGKKKDIDVYLYGLGRIYTEDGKIYLERKFSTEISKGKLTEILNIFYYRRLEIWLIE